MSISTPNGSGLRIAAIHRRKCVTCTRPLSDPSDLRLICAQNFSNLRDHDLDHDHLLAYLSVYDFIAYDSESDCSFVMPVLPASRCPSL